MILLNVSSRERVALLDLGDVEIRDSEVTLSTEGSPWQKQGALADEPRLELPSRSITTVVVDK